MNLIHAHVSLTLDGDGSYHLRRRLEEFSKKDFGLTIKQLQPGFSRGEFLLAQKTITMRDWYRIQEMILEMKENLKRKDLPVRRTRVLFHFKEARYFLDQGIEPSYYLGKLVIIADESAASEILKISRRQTLEVAKDVTLSHGSGLFDKTGGHFLRWYVSYRYLYSSHGGNKALSDFLAATADLIKIHHGRTQPEMYCVAFDDNPDEDLNFIRYEESSTLLR